MFATAAEILKNATNLVVFTGAGVSAESGIPTFRDAGGFWQEFPPSQFANWDGLLEVADQRPERLAAFLQAFIEPIARAAPNAAHAAVARLQDFVPTTVVTQNVDGLHQEAGSTIVQEVHGTFLKVVTWDGVLIQEVTRSDLRRVTEQLVQLRQTPEQITWARIQTAVHPLFGTQPRMYRPKLVMFGDALAEPDWTLAQQACQQCDTMLVVGTSGQVWPAAGLPLYAKERGAKLIEVNPYAADFGGVWLQGAAAEVVPRLVQMAFGV